MASALEKYLVLECAVDWDQVSDFYEARFSSPGQWIFRGHGDSEWKLQSSLERQIEAFGIDTSIALDIERGLVRKFRRQCHHFIQDVPDEHDYLEWLALMQHHGTPTRLLDWTYSFFVALYFALEDARNNSCAVFALNTQWMKSPFESVLNSYPNVRNKWKYDPGILRRDTFDMIFLCDNPIALVGAVTPQRMNQRLVIQQGTFLCPGDVSMSFETNLVSLLSKDDAQPNPNFRKLIVQVDLNTKKSLLLRLHRMNMNSATLYPGIDGFARSLKSLLAQPETLLHPGITNG